MKMADKIELLNNIGTDTLIKNLEEQDEALLKLLTEESEFRASNYSYVASHNDDSPEVKNIISELMLNPPLNTDGKKLTVAQLEAWVSTQRFQYPQLREAIQKQDEIKFQLENYRISIETTKKKTETLKAIIGLRTAQINFLAS
jgi:hypothetical protein